MRAGVLLKQSLQDGFFGQHVLEEEVGKLASGLSSTVTELCDFREVPQPL